MIVLHYFRQFSKDTSGGVEAYIKSICTSLSDRINFKIICDRREGEIEFEIIDGIEVYRMGPQKNKNSSIFEKFFDITIKELIREREKLKKIHGLDYDILHVHGPVSFSGTVHTGWLFLPFYGLQSWRKSKKPVVMTMHGLPEIILGHKYKNLIFNIFFNIWKTIEDWNAADSKKIICVDKYVYDEMTARLKDRARDMSFILNGIDLKRFSKLDKKKARSIISDGYDKTINMESEKKVIGFLNRLAADKGIDIFLSLVPKFPNVQFIIAGDGPYRERVEKMEKTSPNLAYFGTLKEEHVTAFLCSCDYTVNPTVNPAATRVNMESIACETPVLTSAIGDRFPVMHGGNGFLFKDFNELSNLIEKISEGSLKINSFDRSVSNAFDLKITSNKILKIYDELT